MLPGSGQRIPSRSISESVIRYPSILAGFSEWRDCDATEDESMDDVVGACRKPTPHERGVSNSARKVSEIQHLDCLHKAERRVRVWADACTVPDDHVANLHIPIVFPAVLVPRVNLWVHQKGRIPFFNGQLRYLAAETVRLQPPNRYLRFPQTVRRTINTEN